MRNSILIFFIAFLYMNHSKAQQKVTTTTIIDKISIEDGKIFYNKSFSFPGKSQEELFNSAKLWVINHYDNPQDVIIAEDRQLGIIKVRYPKVFPAGGLLESYEFLTTISVQVKPEYLQFYFGDMVVPGYKRHTIERYVLKKNGSVKNEKTLQAVEEEMLLRLNQIMGSI